MTLRADAVADRGRDNADGSSIIDPASLILVSVDDHICEPKGMFDQHVPARYKDEAPVVLEDDNGRQQWWYGDIPGRNLGLNVAAGKPREFFNLDASRYDEMRPGCYDVHERVRDMNAGGQLAGLNFPNWTGFAGQVLNLGPDRYLNEIMIKAYNDWHVDEWCGSYPGRFIPCGILPLADPEAAALEVRRLAAKGCHAVTFSENPEALDMPSLHSGSWDPLFAAACDSETVLCCHLGSSSRGYPLSPDAPPSVMLAGGGLGSVATVLELMWSSIWERFPTLRFSITEGDIGWMPYFVSRSVHVQERQSGWTKHRFPDGKGPKEMFDEHILCCFIHDPIGIELIHHFNIDSVFWESDFPHSDSDWPNAPERFAGLVERLAAEQVAKISHENAMRHYHFDPFAKRPMDTCTAGALRAEATDVDTVTHVGRKATDDEHLRFRATLRPQGRRPASRV